MRTRFAVLACLVCFLLPVMASGSGFISYQDTVVIEDIGPGGGGNMWCFYRHVYREYSDGSAVLLSSEKICEIL